MKFLKDLLFPKMCAGCGAIGSFICLKCRGNLLLIEKQLCFYCKSPSLYGFTHPGCKRQFGIDGTISIYVYNPFLKKLLKTAKYRLAKEALYELLNLSTVPTGLLLYSASSPFSGLPIQPIPLHSSRLRARGFNQGEVICAFIKTLGPSVQILDILERQHNTPAQAQMKTRAERHLNMSLAFKMKNRPKGDFPLDEKAVLLVDDVITSGSTMRAATETLKRASVEKVFAFSLARG